MVSILKQSFGVPCGARDGSGETASGLRVLTKSEVISRMSRNGSEKLTGESERVECYPLSGVSEHFGGPRGALSRTSRRVDSESFLVHAFASLLHRNKFAE
jgi:hypothetical protein